MDNNSKILRSKTKDLHDKTESVFRSQAIMDGSFSLQDYTKLLTASLLYIHSIEESAAKHWSTYAVLLERKRLAIEHDLAEIQINHVVRHDLTSNQNEDAYFLLGKIYVILGSMLGNAVIYKHVKDLPTFEGYALHYLALHQGEVSAIWKEFVNRIDLLDNQEFTFLLGGAKAGYELLQTIAVDIEA